MTKFVPLNKRLLIEAIHEDEKTEGGLFIPEQAREIPMRGTVLAHAKDTGLDIQNGDILLFGKFAGSAIKLNGKDALILHAEDVLGVLVEAQ